MLTCARHACTHHALAHSNYCHLHYPALRPARHATPRPQLRVVFTAIVLLVGAVGVTINDYLHAHRTPPIAAPAQLAAAAAETEIARRHSAVLAACLNGAAITDGARIVQCYVVRP